MNRRGLVFLQEISSQPSCKRSFLNIRYLIYKNDKYNLFFLYIILDNKNLNFKYLINNIVIDFLIF